MSSTPRISRPTSFPCQNVDPDFGETCGHGSAIHEGEKSTDRKKNALRACTLCGCPDYQKPAKAIPAARRRGA